MIGTLTIEDVLVSPTDVSESGIDERVAYCQFERIVLAAYITRTAPVLFAEPPSSTTVVPSCNIGRIAIGMTMGASMYLEVTPANGHMSIAGFVARASGHGIGRCCTCGRLCTICELVSTWLIAVYVHLMTPARTICDDLRQTAVRTLRRSALDVDAFPRFLPCTIGD